MSDNYSKQIDTPEGFAWYRRLEEPDPESGKFSLCVAFKDEGSTAKWLDGLEKELSKWGKDKWGNKPFHMPIKRGENVKAEGYATINASSKFEVDIVGYDDNGEVTEKKARDVRKGSPVIATLNIRSYDKSGNRGITSYLRYVCLLSDTPDNSFLEASGSEKGGALSHFKPRKPAEAEGEAPSF